MKRTTWMLSWAATALATVAAAAGLLTATYRDTAAMVDQARGADLATLLVAVPLLAVSLPAARRESARGRIAVAAGLAYLAYNYAIAAFHVVINPMTPVYIAILGTACWALAGMAPTLVRAGTALDAGLPRRTTIVFLSLVVVMFAGLWLSQIGGAIASGSLPDAVAELHLPTSAVYVLDLAFVLPAFAAAAVQLARRSALGGVLGLGCVVFSVLMALSIAGMSVVQAAQGTLEDPVLAIVFATIAAVAATLALIGIRRTPVDIEAEWAHVHGHAVRGGTRG